MGDKYKKRIEWHPGFYGGLELELRKYKECLNYESEHELSKKPLRIDMLIIYKKVNSEIENSIGRIFRRFNIVEYKSPNDELTIDVFYKTIGYAALFKGLGKKYNDIPAEEITISLFRHRKPEKLLKELKKSGADIENVSPGIYYISEIIIFPIQIVVMSELPKEMNSPLRILAPNVLEEDIRGFIEAALDYKEPDDRQNVDAVMQVCVSANSETYRKIREEDGMCEALKELMKDEIEKDVQAGYDRGVCDGKQEGVLATLYDLVKKGLLEIRDAAVQAGMSETAFSKEMKKAGY